MGEELLIFLCYGCGQPAGACPDCVNTILVDPETRLPIDLMLIDGRQVKVVPTKEARARSVNEAICDDCVRERNRRNPASPLETSRDRHQRNHI